MRSALLALAVVSIPLAGCQPPGPGVARPPPEEADAALADGGTVAPTDAGVADAGLSLDAGDIDAGDIDADIVDAGGDADSGTPGCAGGERMCPSGCTNASSDPSNCGMCGVVCPVVCFASTCTTTCPRGWAPCRGTCVRGACP